MDVDHQRRIANNEVMFRGYNEAIRDAIDDFRSTPDDGSTHGVMCECAVTECDQTLDLTMTQYVEARSDPAWFIVTPDHIFEGVEHVVHDRGSYWIIEKEGLGKEIAEADAEDDS